MRSSEYLMKRCYYVIQDKKVQEGRSEKERREKRNTPSRDIYRQRERGSERVLYLVLPPLRIYPVLLFLKVVIPISIRKVRIQPTNQRVSYSYSTRLLTTISTR